jgi:DNA replication protein DnaC
MSDTPQVLLAHHLKALRLPTFLREYDKQARQCAAEGVDHSRYLLRLAELEMIDRERRTVERRIKEARFPAVKSLDSFDFAAILSLLKTLSADNSSSQIRASQNFSAGSEENANLIGGVGRGLRQSGSPLESPIVRTRF